MMSATSLYKNIKGFREKIDTLFESTDCLVDLPEWNCKRCTYLNQTGGSRCGICNAERKDRVKGWQCSYCTVINQLYMDKCSTCPNPRPEQVDNQLFKRKQKIIDYNQYEWQCYWCKVVNKPQGTACANEWCHRPKTVKFCILTKIPHFNRNS